MTKIDPFATIATSHVEAANGTSLLASRGREVFRHSRAGVQIQPFVVPHTHTCLQPPAIRVDHRTSSYLITHLMFEAAMDRQRWLHLVLQHRCGRASQLLGREYLSLSSPKRIIISQITLAQPKSLFRRTTHIMIRLCVRITTTRLVHHILMPIEPLTRSTPLQMRARISAANCVAPPTMSISPHKPILSQLALDVTF